MPSTWSVTTFVDWLQGKPPGASEEGSARNDRRRRPRPRPRAIPWRPVDGEDPGELFETGWPDEVFVLQSVFRDIRGHLPDDPGDQRYGFLLGRRLECPATSDPYLLIDEIWAAPDPLRERGGTQGFEVELEAARRRAARGEKDVLGWYHTHSPLMGLSLSEHDVRLHSRFFPERWHCALVEVAHGEAPMGGIFQRRLKHRYPGTKLISFLEVSEANGGSRWGEMESQLDWTNYETPRSSVRRVAPPREPGPVIRARGRALPEVTREEAPVRRRPVDGPSWKWLPPSPSDGNGDASPAATRPAARSGQAATSSPRRTNGKTEPPGDVSPTADGRGPGGRTIYPTPPSSLPPTLSDPAAARERLPKKRDATPEPAGEWVSSPLPPRRRTVQDGAGVAPDEAEAERAAEAAPEEETPSEEAAAEAVAEETAVPQAAVEAAAPQGAVEVADEPPAEVDEATAEDAAAADARVDAAAAAVAAAATPPPVAPIPPEPVEESVAPPQGRSGERIPLELEAVERSHVRPAVVPSARSESYPFRLEPAEESAPVSNLGRALDALRTVIATRRRGDLLATEGAATSITDESGGQVEDGHSDLEPVRPPSTAAERAAVSGTPGRGRALAGGDVSGENVPVLLPAGETWSEQTADRLPQHLLLKVLAAVTVLLVGGFLALQLRDGIDASRAAEFDRGRTATETPRSPTLDSRMDALAASLSVFADRHGRLRPGESDCGALRIALGSVERNHDRLFEFVQRTEELPDDAASRWRSLSARVDAAHEDFQEAGCETES